MDIITAIIICYVVLAAVVYISIRNNRVGMFRIMLNHLTSDLILNYLNSKKEKSFQEQQDEYDYLVQRRYHIINKHTYERMLFSFKPLQIDSWFSEEDVEYMQQFKQYLPTSEELHQSVDKALKND